MTDIEDIAWKAWLTLPHKAKANLRISLVAPDQRPWVQLAIYMAHNGDKSARRAVRKLFLPGGIPIARIAVPPRPTAITRGRGNPMDVFCYGAHATKLENKND